MVISWYVPSQGRRRLPAACLSADRDRQGKPVPGNGMGCGGRETATTMAEPWRYAWCSRKLVFLPSTTAIAGYSLQAHANPPLFLWRDVPKKTKHIKNQLILIQT